MNVNNIKEKNENKNKLEPNRVNNNCSANNNK